MDTETKPEIKRLYSLDALRGFDMFWIMGGEFIFIGLATITGWPVLKWWAEQQQHMPWSGFHFEDMIFPLFLFIAGISFSFSLAKRLQRGDARRSIYSHVIKRGLILVVLGILYNNAVNFDFSQLRYASVLGRIGLAWMFAALIFMNSNPRYRIIWTGGILIFYWLLLLIFPAHDLGTFGPFSQQGNLAGFIDRHLLPGSFCCYTYGDSEGILSTIPAISTALLGMLTGQFLMSPFLKEKPLRKVLYMVIAAIILIIIGRIWNLVFPINKYLWSSSFVCFVGGLSLLLFCVFYLIIDIWNYRKWAFFFVVIGMNPITIYLAGRIINFDSTAKFFFGGLMSYFPESWTTFWNGIAITAVGWVFLYILYKKKIFLKV
jgi:predicted acyltransferase